MLYGTVAKFFPEKGYGFIRPDFGPDVFFHLTALGACRPCAEIAPGQAVKYELVPGTEPKTGRRARIRRDEGEKATASVRPQAKLVELIDRIPGAILKSAGTTKPPEHHPRARKKKPTWRRQV
jgi:cold shock CspA family protein